MNPKAAPMKMVLILCPDSRLEEIRALLDEHHLQGYTELDGLRGCGTTGKRLGTRAHPGSSAMVFAAVEASKTEELVAALGEFCRTCADAEGVRVLVLPVERMI